MFLLKLWVLGVIPHYCEAQEGRAEKPSDVPPGPYSVREWQVEVNADRFYLTQLQFRPLPQNAAQSHTGRHYAIQTIWGNKPSTARGTKHNSRVRSSRVSDTRTTVQLKMLKGREKKELETRERKKMSSKKNGPHNRSYTAEERISELKEILRMKREYNRKMGIRKGRLKDMGNRIMSNI